MKRFTAALLMAFLVAATLVPAYAQANIPPHTDYFYVNDFADILSGETKNHIVAVNDDLHARTGAQIVITTVNFLDGADIEDYSLEMANSWGIGSEKNNGLLMLLAVSEQPGNRFMIQAGTDLRAKMPVSTFESILEEHFYHFFDAGSYDTAVRRAFDALALHIDGLYAEINAPAAAGPVTSQPAGNPVEYTGGQSPINRLIDGFWGVVRFIVITVVVIAVIAIVFGASFAGRRRHYG
ncbi:MAG: TPM domain-containing protein, partial [Defluviitaleaceae bacterium]|nr:TPM domain-containing protein [Defluviitaleaceae bacterium]